MSASTVTITGSFTRATDGGLRPAPPADIRLDDLPIPNGYILTITHFNLAIILGISIAAGIFFLLSAGTMAMRWYRHGVPPWHCLSPRKSENKGSGGREKGSFIQEGTKAVQVLDNGEGDEVLDEKMVVRE